MPITFDWLRVIIAAATDESTPPDIATTVASLVTTPSNSLLISNVSMVFS